MSMDGYGCMWIRLLAAPQGFEPRYADPESAVLPLNEGATGALGDLLQPYGRPRKGCTMPTSLS